MEFSKKKLLLISVLLALIISIVSTVIAFETSKYTSVEVNGEKIDTYTDFEEKYKTKVGQTSQVYVEDVIDNFLKKYITDTYEKELSTDKYILKWLKDENVVEKNSIYIYKANLGLNYLIKDLYKNELKDFNTSNIDKKNYYISYISYDNKKEYKDYLFLIKKKDTKLFYKYGFSVNNVNKYSTRKDLNSLYSIVDNIKDKDDVFKFKFNGKEYIGVILNTHKIPEDILRENYAVSLFDKNMSKLSTPETYLALFNKMNDLDNIEYKASRIFTQNLQKEITQGTFTSSFQYKVHQIIDKKYSEDWSEIYEK